jgi:hypothetical protein
MRNQRILDRRFASRSPWISILLLAACVGNPDQQREAHPADQVAWWQDPADPRFTATRTGTAALFELTPESDVPKGVYVGFLPAAASALDPDPAVLEYRGKGLGPAGLGLPQQFDNCDIPKNAFFVERLVAGGNAVPGIGLYEITFHSAHQPRGLIFAYPTWAPPLGAGYRRLADAEIKEVRWYRRTTAAVFPFLLGLESGASLPPGYRPVDRGPSFWAPLRHEAPLLFVGAGHEGTETAPTYWLLSRDPSVTGFPLGAVLGVRGASSVLPGFEQTQAPSRWMRSFRAIPN